MKVPIDKIFKDSPTPMDLARGAEAVRRVNKEYDCTFKPEGDDLTLAGTAAKLGREGWMPANPLLAKARRMAADEVDDEDDRNEILRGIWDDDDRVQIVYRTLQKIEKKEPSHG